VQNWIKIDSAVAALRTHEKTQFRVGFFVYISVYPFFATPTGHIFSAILTLNGSYDVLLQPLVPFGGRDEIAQHLGVKFPKTPHFGGVNRRFQAKLVKSKNMHIIKTIASIPPSWKNRKITIDRFRPNLAWRCSSTLFSRPTVKNFKFKNPRWRRPPS